MKFSYLKIFPISVVISQFSVKSEKECANLYITSHFN